MTESNRQPRSSSVRTQPDAAAPALANPFQKRKTLLVLGIALVMGAGVILSVAFMLGEDMPSVLGVVLKGLGALELTAGLVALVLGLQKAE